MTLSIPFRSIQHVFFDDLDALNILHNVRFVLFMERARGEFLNSLGFGWKDDLATNPDKYHVVAEHQIRYIASVRSDGNLVVEVTPRHIGRSSFIIYAEVRAMHGPTIFAEGTTRLVRLDPTTNKPCSWSDRFRNVITPLIISETKPA